MENEGKANITDEKNHRETARRQAFHHISGQWMYEKASQT